MTTATTPRDESTPAERRFMTLLGWTFSGDPRGVIAQIVITAGLLAWWANTQITAVVAAILIGGYLWWGGATMLFDHSNAVDADRRRWGFVLAAPWVALRLIVVFAVGSTLLAVALGTVMSACTGGR